jgi:hypothetical protein
MGQQEIVCYKKASYMGSKKTCLFQEGQYMSRRTCLIQEVTYVFKEGLSYSRRHVIWGQ